MTAEQAGLLAKARRSLRSAEVLLRDGDHDAAVSRAYYAMFYLAEALLLSKNLAFSSHAATIAAFGKEFAKTGALPAELHAYIREAAEARNMGDYQVDSRLNPETASRHIQRAQQFLLKTEHFLAPPGNPSV
jgi:uncharacterized protein (UPF0332 family)